MVVLACEGASEVKLMTCLLENNELVFDIKDILDGRPIHFRQPKEIAALIDILPKTERITFYRIGDTQKDDFNVACFSARKNNIVVYKICTKPEIEILIIINEHLYEEYLKAKSKISPKQFVKSNVGGYVGFSDYVEKHDMVWAIKEYKRIKQNNKEELYLSDFIKK